MSRWLRYPAIFFLALVWFSLIQSWGMFAEPDAFYHAKISALMAVQGPLTSFPWLDLTTVSAHFADQHFLFHVGLIPFVKIFGMFYGTQFAAVVFAALFICILAYALRVLSLKYYAIWIVLALTTSALVFRLLLGKATPWALAFFVLGLVAVALKRPVLGAFMGLGFALSHGGWVILLGAQFLYLAGEIIFYRVVEERPWRFSVLATGLNSWLATIAGCLIGLLIHPNFPEDLNFLWIQVVKIGLLTPQSRVQMGQEWSGADPASLLGSLGMLVIAALAAVYGLLFARRMPLNLKRARQVSGFSFVFAAIFVFTLKSQRMVEYLAPTFILWLAAIWMLIDVKKLWQEFKPRRVLVVFLALLLIGVTGRSVQRVHHSLRNGASPFNADQKLVEVIQQHTAPNERVFHTRFDEFPELFAWLDRQRYVAGLDPTFLLEANPELSDKYQQLTESRDPAQISLTVSADFGARLLVVSRLDSQEFQQVLASSTRFNLLYQDERNLLYQVQP